MLIVPKLEGHVEAQEEEVEYKEDMIKVEVDIKCEKELKQEQPSIQRRRGKGKKTALTASERQKKYVAKKKAEGRTAFLQKAHKVTKVSRRRKGGMVDCRRENTVEGYNTQTVMEIREEFVEAMNNYRNRVVATVKEHPTDPGMIKAMKATTNTLKMLMNCSHQSFPFEMDKSFMQIDKRISELKNPNKFEQIIKKFTNNLNKV
jgi:hypothetical protein